MAERDITHIDLQSGFQPFSDSKLVYLKNVPLYSNCLCTSKYATWLYNEIDGEIGVQSRSGFAVLD